jgi:prepilin peptidase CpaA
VRLESACGSSRTMTPNPVYSQTVLVITAAVLVYAAFNDLQHYKIRNELIVVLAMLYGAHALLSGRWMTAHWNLAFAFFMFVVMCVFYSKRLMGGGDLKLLTIAFLWVGIGCALPFAILLLAFSAIHVVAVRLGWLEARQADYGGSGKIPFAPSVAAALISLFMLGCLSSKTDALQTGEPQTHHLGTTLVAEIPRQNAASAAISFPMAR